MVASLNYRGSYAASKPDGLIWAGTTEEEAGFDEGNDRRGTGQGDGRPSDDGAIVGGGGTGAADGLPPSPFRRRDAGCWKSAGLGKPLRRHRRWTERVSCGARGCVPGRRTWSCVANPACRVGASRGGEVQGRVRGCMRNTHLPSRHSRAGGNPDPRPPQESQPTWERPLVLTHPLRPGHVGGFIPQTPLNL